MFTGSLEPPKVIVRTRGGFRQALRNGSIALLLIVVLSGISLVFWPFPQARSPQVSRSGDSVATYLSSVNRALEQGHTLPSATIREGDWNRFVRDAHPDDTRRLSVFMMQDKLVLVADEQTGPFRIGTRMVLVKPELQDGLEVEQLWVGHLPLPRFLAGAWSKSLARRYQLDLNPRLWEVLAFQATESGRVMIGPQTGESAP